MAPPLAGREHAPRRLLRPEEHRVEIGGDHALPFLSRKLDGAIGMRDAGIVDQHGHGAERLLGGIERGAHRLAVAHVGLDRDRTAARLLDPLLQRREPVGAPRHQGDRRAVLREHFGEAHAEPARCSGYQRHLAGKVEDLCRGHEISP